jgi:hypothetical protein
MTNDEGMTKPEWNTRARAHARNRGMGARSEIGGQRFYCGSPMRRTSSAKHGLERRPSRCAVVLKVNYKKASQSDCDQVFGYGDEDVFCV